MSKNHQIFGLTTCLTTYKKSNNFTISRCSEGGIAHRSGRWDRRFESCHFDQKTAENKLFWLVFGCFSIYFLQNRLFLVDHMFALISNLWTVFSPWFSLCFKKPLFFAYCDANFEGWQFFSVSPRSYHLDKLEFVFLIAFLLLLNNSSCSLSDTLYFENHYMTKSL